MPPADIEKRDSFQKHPKTKARSSQRRSSERPAYDDEEFRRGSWVAVGLVAAILVVGGGLIILGMR